MKKQKLKNGIRNLVKTKSGTTLQVLNDACAIEWPAEGKDRIRKVVKRSNARSTVKYPCIKANRMVQCESVLERDAVILHDVDTVVKRVEEQYAKIHFIYDGKWHDHVPDLYVETARSKIFREIKPDKAKDDEFILARTALLSSLLPKFGFSYDVLFESKIRQQPRLDNATFVTKYGRYHIPLNFQEQIRRTVLANSELTWGDVRKGMLGKGGLQALCHLIVRGKIPVNYEEEWIDDACVLTLNTNSLEVCDG